MVRTYDNKVAWCPICNQGWVEIVKDIRTGTLFCCCDECETEWANPFNIEESDCLSRGSFGQVVDPDDDEIKEIGWDTYILRN